MPGPDLLPPGPLRELVEALHGLYQGAGMPGLRRISKAVNDGDFRDMVSHEKVSAMLHGKGLPRWSKLEPVVRVLATWHTSALDADAETARFQRLWHAAQSRRTDMASSPDSQQEVARESDQNTRSGNPDADGDTTNLVHVISAEIAAQARSDHQSESERGYRDGVKFVRALPTWRELERLAKVDFDVAAWIKPKNDQWGYIAAGMDPHNPHLPEWAGEAAHYLGRLADPIGFDHTSFTPTNEYLDAFGAGLRAVWESAQAEERSGSIAANRDHDSLAQIEPEPSPPSHRIADDLGRLLQGHAGLSLDDVEQAGRTLLEQLHERFQQTTVRERLPHGTTMTVDWFSTPSDCNYGGRPYRLLNGVNQGLKVDVTAQKPVPVRAECTPIPGISRARDAEHGLIVIDANRPAASPLLLAITDVHPVLSSGTANKIAEWVEQCMTTLLTQFGQGLTAGLGRLGYDS
jgi:hypothetical protein